MEQSKEPETAQRHRHPPSDKPTQPGNPPRSECSPKPAGTRQLATAPTSLQRRPTSGSVDPSSAERVLTPRPGAANTRSQLHLRSRASGTGRRRQEYGENRSEEHTSELQSTMY